MEIKRILLLGPSENMSLHGGIVTHMKLLGIISKTDNFDFELNSLTIGKRSFFREKISFYKILYSYVNYIKILLFEKYDIVHINASMKNNSILKNFATLLIAKLFLKKVVFQFHGGSPKDIKSYYKYFLKKIVMWSNAMLVLTDEQSAIRLYLDTSEQSKIQKVPNYITIRNVDIKDRKNLKHIHFLFIGRVIKEKGIFEIIEAVKNISQKFDNFRIDVMGDGPELDNMKKVVKNLGLNNYFLFHGFVIDGKDKIFSDSHVLLIPSYREGFPYTVLESMLFEMPIIATGVGALSEIIDNGKNGFLIDCKDVGALSDKMEYFLLNPQQIKIYGKQSFKILVQRYSTEVMKKNFTEIYSEVLK